MKPMMIKKLLLAVLVTGLCSFATPPGWFTAGNRPQDYNMGVDQKNIATIKSVAPEIKGFGTLMQECRPTKYSGKRVRMSGFVKSENVADWAGMWFRVDQANSQMPLSFDNMQDRAIKGNTDWKKYEIVLDVPENASKLAFGALLSGTGQIWFKDFSFEIVDDSVPVTGQSQQYQILPEPTNLNFSL